VLNLATESLLLIIKNAHINDFSVLFQHGDVGRRAGRPADDGDEAGEHGRVEQNRIGSVPVSFGDRGKVTPVKNSQRQDDVSMQIIDGNS